MRSRVTVAERFWSKVDKNGPVPAYAPHLGPCWLWTGDKNWKGYGLFWDGSRKLAAHRWALAEVDGPIPAGMQLDHLCRTRLCVRPKHLEVVTSRTNTLRGQGNAALNARKTSCPQGHPYDLFNTRFGSGRQGRKCKTCARQLQREKAASAS